LTGALIKPALSPLLSAVELLLVCVVGAHPFVWALRPPTFALMPQTVTPELAPLTGALTAEPSSLLPLGELPLELLCVVWLQELL
jgi:hypothetical protein